MLFPVLRVGQNLTQLERHSFSDNTLLNFKLKFSTVNVILICRVFYIRIRHKSEYVAFSYTNAIIN